VARTCAICESDADTIETALPLWLADVLGPGAKEGVYDDLDAGYREAEAVPLRAKRACRPL
jgi:hypothetical protein